MPDNWNKHTYRGVSEPTTTLKESERRTSGRHVFTASADVVELGSGARFSTRTTDLGPGGCFVDTTNPFAVGSRVRIALHKGKNVFETPGVVVYSQHGLGMGIAFDEIDPAQRAALDLWIAELTGQSVPPHEVLRPGRKFDANLSWLRSNSDHASLVRLIQLMITKGILTEAEGSSVLVDPVL
jgi:hypothetical protein